jgi:hypothetical protein
MVQEGSMAPIFLKRIHSDLDRILNM